MPLKSGVLKRLKKLTHNPCHSPKRPIIEAVPEKSPSSTKNVSRSKRIRKPEITRKGENIREISAPVSPTSEKKKSSGNGEEA